MKIALLATLSVLGLAACAQRPDAIAPVSMPSNMYAAYSCDEARNEINVVSHNVAALSKAQNGAATGDAIGVFLLGVPTSSLTGGDKSGELAAEKGKLIALETRMTQCK